MSAHINAIARSVPQQEFHQTFIQMIDQQLEGKREHPIFNRMVKACHIDSRYTVLPLSHDANFKRPVADFYNQVNHPKTGERMLTFEKYAFQLAKPAVEKVLSTVNKDSLTHIIICSCTGFYAPGLDYDIMQHFDLPANIERTQVGFMGCHGAINALKVADHIVKANPNAKVLLVNCELCSLHFRKNIEPANLLGFLLFADGATAAVISAETNGLKIEGFYSHVIPDTAEQITWHIADEGFEMHLSPKIPSMMLDQLPDLMPKVLADHSKDDINLWAIHPGGRRILDSVKSAIPIAEPELQFSRSVLRRYGNMSSATLMFILHDMLYNTEIQGNGCAMGFGPGVAVESMRFKKS